MLAKSLFVVILLACLLSSGYALAYDKLRIFVYYYVPEAYKNILQVGEDYDILCLYNLPKYYLPEQKSNAHRFIFELALRNKFSVFRKYNHDMAIFSKFPIQVKEEIDFSPKYGAQRIVFIAGGKIIQVANVFHPSNSYSISFKQKLQDVSKVINWMNQAENKGDINVLAGYLYQNTYYFDRLIQENKMSIRGYCPSASCIYAWGKYNDYLFDRYSVPSRSNGVTYTYLFRATFNYIPNRCVSIECGKARLAVNGEISGTNYQWAFFETQQYANSNNYEYLLIIEHPKYGGTGNWGGVRISCPFDGVSFLTLNSKLTQEKSYAWAFWGSWQYIQNNIYLKDTRFNYDPINLTLKSAGFWTGYLAPNNPVKSWEMAFFGTYKYIKSAQARHPTTIIISDEGEY